MAIQFRRGKEDDLVSENLLIGEPAYCTDSHKLLISRGNGVNDLIVRESEVDAKIETEVNSVLDEHLADAIATATERKRLWNGTLTAGNTVTLSDDLSKYRQCYFVVEGTATYPSSIVHGTSVRGGGTFAGDEFIQTFAVRGVYTQASKAFKLDEITMFNIRTSGITQNTSYTTITEIWGLK